MKKNKIHKQYKTKLRFKQPPWYRYLALPLLSISIGVLCWIINYNLRELNINYALPNSIYLYSLLFTMLFGLFSWYISPISFSKVQRTRRILKRVIEENKFYYQDSEAHAIRSSMIIKFKWHNDQFILDVYPEGAKYSSKMNELTTIFQTALNMTVIAVQEDFANHTTYVLSKETNNYIDSTNEWTV
ncbi:MAG: hypothetical protein M3Z48_01385 [Lactobacillus sp.]|uniref:hypothetical protein n=1 Tax=Bacillus cereus group TaxID=86661 RepID=UPI0010BD5CD0|nr:MULTISPECIES: hypothetical protein [Bacillus cereus group]MCT6901865.1 hypothetical protein [Lactobacillus sp.]MCG3796869.1 hypothetical protein [Bacillus toyonensis]MCU5551333.1 hypothetical protein [Bacillus cereus]TKI39114.1 hypothetical protein FC683_03910 [Bacillus cereus]HDR8106643.1 hypothetical protein [Bacillus cereus]